MADERGRVFVKRGVISEPQLAECLAELNRSESAGRHTTLVDIIVARGFATKSQLAAVASVPAAPPAVPAEVADARRDPKRVMGKYTLVRELGRGGMAVVYKAWDEMLGQFVALKVLRSDDLIGGEGDPKVQEFLREARMAVRLRHPNIVRVYELGRAGDRYFLSMEFIEGKTLLKLIHGEKERGGRSAFYGEPETFVLVLRDVALALDYAHRQEPPIVHRDVKPHNILVDAAGRACVVDFGLAKEQGSAQRLTMTGVAKGTPCYMSPEQAQPSSHRVDPRTDVWSLGAVLYECLTGRPPFTGASSHEILAKVVNEEVVAPSAWMREHGGPSVPPADLERVCLKALEKDPQRRYATAKAMADDLDRFLSGGKVEAKAPAAHDRVARWVQRRKAVVGAVAAAVVMGIVALVAVLSRGTPERVVEKVLVKDETSAKLKETLDKVDALAGQMDYQRAAAAYGELRSKLAEGAERKLIEGKLEEIRLQELVLKGLVERIQKEPREFVRFAAAGETLATVRVNDATNERIFLRYAGRALDLPWGEVGPATYLALVQDYWKEIDGEAALGFGIWCLRNGQRAAAIKALNSLRGTSLASLAKPYLAEMGETFSDGPVAKGVETSKPVEPRGMPAMEKPKKKWPLNLLAHPDGWTLGELNALKEGTLRIWSDERAAVFRTEEMGEGQSLTVTVGVDRTAAKSSQRLCVGFVDEDAWNGYALIDLQMKTVTLSSGGDDAVTARLEGWRDTGTTVRLTIRRAILHAEVEGRAYGCARMKSGGGRVAVSASGVWAQVTTLVMTEPPGGVAAREPALPSRASLLASARVKNASGDSAGAIAAASEILVEDPANLDALVERGRALLAQGRLAAAVDDFTSATWISQRSAAAYGGRARAKLRLGHNGDAQSDAEVALDIDPGQTDALLARAELRAAARKFDAAIEDALRAAKAGAKGASLVLAWCKWEQGDLSGALQSSQVAVEEEPQNAQAWRRRALFCMAASRWTDCVLAASKALQMDPKFVYCRLWMALSLMRLGQHADAAKQLKDWPEDGEAWPKRIAAFLLNDLSESDLIGSTDGGIRLKCEAHYYAAMKALVAGNKVVAKAQLSRCRDTDAVDVLEHRAAGYALEELKK